MTINDDIRKILDIAVKLSGEKDYAMLLEGVIGDAMDITGCDAGTLYLLNNSKLDFMILRNNTMNVSMGGNGEPISMIPPVVLDDKYVAAYSAIHKKVVNIADVYKDSSFDWEGPRKYDSMTGYHTQSMLVVPLHEHDGDVIGVLQLLNAKDEQGNIISFDESSEKVVFSIASETAISLSNMLMIKQLENLLQSFVSSMTTAIDERTPYNANHTKKVAGYCSQVTDYIRRQFAEGKLDFNIDDNTRDQLIMSAMLHDCGKLITPLEIMNKADRLADRLPVMEMRWKYIHKLIACKYLGNEMSEDEYQRLDDMLLRGEELVRKCNCAGFICDEDRAELEKYYVVKFDDNGETVDFINADEYTELSIVKGTLTQDERKIIENHVVYTSRILSEIEFGDNYNKVRYYAGAHHEYLDGSGYPNHLKGDEIEIPVRLLTIMDVYDSLTAADRPYKKPMPKEKAFSILEEMADEGKLDKKLVAVSRECLGAE